MRTFVSRTGLALAVLCCALLPSLAESQGTRGIQHIRPLDRSGLNVFEDPKADTTSFTDQRVSFGGAFAQEFQGLRHSSTAAPNIVNGIDVNQLETIGAGMNTAMANLFMNVQLAPGIRVSLTTYLSSRNHNDAWVKDGYMLIDGSPYNVPLLNAIMEKVTLKVGHFEINYGDAHFRRTDGGNALFNPFVGNLIIDAFTTEIGAEAYYRSGPWLAMVGATGGEIRGNTGPADERSPSVLGKVGYDANLSDDLRVRLTSSVYSTSRSVKNTLHSGDRAGSHYFGVMDNTTNNWSGYIWTEMTSNVTAVVFNPFVKFRNLEFFGNIETITGGASTEVDRTWRQQSADVIYRLFDEQAYLAARYNVASGQFAGIANDVGATRLQFGGGLFVTKNILAKLEYVHQSYNDFPAADHRNGGVFQGLMLQGAVTF